MYSHLLGVIFWIVSAPFFLIKLYNCENHTAIIGVLVYFISFFMLFSSSTLYHSSYIAKKRFRYRQMDHISIYFFIARTYTPIILLYINDSFGQKVLFTLWFVTLFGTVFKIFFLGKFRIISTVIYLLMGWTAVFIMNSLLETMPLNIFYWIVAGGIIYTIGTIFYTFRKIPYNHFIWHITVLCGAVCHFVAIYLSL